MNEKRYEIKTYDFDGDYVGLVDPREVEFEYFDKIINSGCGRIRFDRGMKTEDADNTTDFNTEYRISVIDRDTGSDSDVIYSGWLSNRDKVITDTERVRVGVTGFASKLSRQFYTESYNYLNFSHTNSPGDHIEKVIDNYRALNSTVYDSEETTDTGAGFGSTTRRGVTFTTGTTDEEALITRVDMSMQYASGTNEGVTCAVYAVDGDRKPTGAALVSIEFPAMTHTSGYKWVKCIFDTPYQLSTSTEYAIVVFSASSDANAYNVERNTSSSHDGIQVDSTDGGNSWVTGTAISLFKMYYADESKVRINYTDDSISDVTETINITFTKETHGKALDRILEHSPSNWYWYLDADNTLQFHPFGISDFLLIDDCDATTGWTGNGLANIATDTNDKKEGDACVKFDVDGSTADNYIYKTISSIDISAYRYVGPSWVYVPSAAGIDNIGVFLGDGTNLTQWLANIGGTSRLKDGWNYVLPWFDLTKNPNSVVGTGCDKTAVTYIRFEVDTLSSDVTIDGIKFDNYVAANLNHHTLTLGKDVKEIHQNKTIENLKNEYIISNNDDLTTLYENTDSVDDYGASTEYKTDGRLSVQATSDRMGNQFLNRNASPRHEMKIVANDEYDIESIDPGHTINIRNTLLNIDDYLIVKSVDYSLDKAIIEVDDRPEELSRALSETEKQLNDHESKNSSIGDTPNNY